MVSSAATKVSPLWLNGTSACWRSCCLDLEALHVGSSGMPSMCAGQTIGRLCQPAPGVLGGLGTRERHLSFHLRRGRPPGLYCLSSAADTGRFRTSTP